jgi:hypothetical protein
MQTVLLMAGTAAGHRYGVLDGGLVDHLGVNNLAATVQRPTVATGTAGWRQRPAARQRLLDSSPVSLLLGISSCSNSGLHLVVNLLQDFVRRRNGRIAASPAPASAG